MHRGLNQLLACLRIGRVHLRLKAIFFPCISNAELNSATAKDLGHSVSVNKYKNYGCKKNNVKKTDSKPITKDWITSLSEKDSHERIMYRLQGT